MKKPILERFIELCSLEDISKFTKERDFDEDKLKDLYIGFCTIDILESLFAEYSKQEIKDAGFFNKTGGFIYANRIIIPYSKDYFSARSINRNDKYKNLFPKGKNKIPFFIPGTNDSCFITEGETDALRLHHIFPKTNIFSINGTMGYGLLRQLKDKFKGKDIIFCYDNDEPGKKCLEDSMKIMSTFQHSFQLFKCEFNNKHKDIDEYFINDGLKEDLKYIELTEKNIYNKEIKDISIKVVNALDALNNPIPKIEYLINPLIRKGGLTIIGGEPGTKKLSYLY